MFLLIDGYNLIKSSSSQIFVSDSLRKYYVNQLNIYCKKKNHKAILVFDGGTFAYPSKEIIDLVTIIFSGYKSTADQVIKNYISENKGKDLILITSDRDLQKFAKSLNFEFLPVSEFNGFLFNKEKDRVADTIKIKDQAIKTSNEHNFDLDNLMNKISNIEILKDDDIISNKHQKANSISKTKKQLIKKIKKL